MNDTENKDAQPKPSEKLMWEDPQKKSECGVLLAEDIRFYVDRGLLISKHFNKKRLKGAGYSLAPDITNAWMFDDKKRMTKLEVVNEEGGECCIVPENSIVYIQIKEELKIPYYIIGRHNLTIKQVYQGLLLGTGPQVDPGYEGHLFIPLHNLTNREVRLYPEKSFVSIDFVKTIPLKLREIPDTDAEFRELYPEKNQIPEDKKNRRKLRDYLPEGKEPRSSMAGVKDIANEAKTEAETVSKDRRKWDIGLGVGVLSLNIAIVSIFVGFYLYLNGKVYSIAEAGFEKRMSAVEDAFKQMKKSNIKNLSDRLTDLEACSAANTNVILHVPVPVQHPSGNDMPPPNSLSKTNVAVINLKVGVDK